MRIDFHTHILPAVDDGSKNIEQSIQMLEMEAEQGVDIVVATPHFYPQDDYPDKFMQRRQAAYEKLIDKIGSNTNFPQIILCAEVYYFKGISDWSDLKNLCIGNTQYVLLEMPMDKWTDRMFEEIDDIYRKQGLIPIIAHIDRYLNIFNMGSILKKLLASKVVIQANTSYFIEKRTRKIALKLLENNVINILGSDCHNIQTRKPDLLQAEEIIFQKLGQGFIDYLNSAGEKILLKK